MIGTGSDLDDPVSVSKDDARSEDVLRLDTVSHEREERREPEVESPPDELGFAFPSWRNVNPGKEYSDACSDCELIVADALGLAVSRGAEGSVAVVGYPESITTVDETFLLRREDGSVEGVQALVNPDWNERILDLLGTRGSGGRSLRDHSQELVLVGKLSGPPGSGREKARKVGKTCLLRKRRGSGLVQDQDLELKLPFVRHLTIGSQTLSEKCPEMSRGHRRRAFLVEQWARGRAVRSWWNSRRDRGFEARTRSDDLAVSTDSKNEDIELSTNGGLWEYYVRERAASPGVSRRKRRGAP